MRYFRKKTLVLSALLAAVLTACVPTKQTDISRDPDPAKPSADVVLSFEQLHNDTLEAFEADERTPYLFITNAEISGDNDKKLIVIKAECLDDVTKEDAAQFIAAVLRHMNDAAISQKSDCRMSNSQDFGGLYEEYSIRAEVKTVSGNEPLAVWEVKAGEDIPLNPAIEIYEEEWEKEYQRYLNNLVYDVNGNIVKGAD